MHDGIYKYQLLAIVAIFLFASCGVDQGVNVTDPGLIDGSSELLVIDGGENASLDVMKGKTSYFDLAVKNTGSNSHISTGIKKGWTLQWKSPVPHDTTYESVTLYSTYDEEYWKPLNYLLNNREEITESIPGAGYREIQAAMWMLLDFTEFSLESSNASDLPEDMRTNSEYNFDIPKVQQIVDMAISGGNGFEYTLSSTCAVVAKSSSDNEIVIIEDSFFAIEVVNLKEQYDLDVAWTVNDYGQIAGGNMFVEADGTSVNMGNIFARSMNNSGQVVGNSGQHAAYWDEVGGVLELSSPNESDRSQANDINDQGDIAGEIISEYLLYEDEYGDVYEEEYHSFVWSETSGNQSISSEGWAFGINNFGDVVGLDYTVDNRAYIWNSQDGLESLGSFHGFSSARGHSINNSSQVVGSVLVSQDGSVASLTTSLAAQQNMKQIDLEIKKANLDGVYAREHILEMVQSSSLDREVSSLGKSLQADVSNLDRTFVSKMNSVSSSQSEAFIWDESHGMMSLGTLGGDWSIAWDINDKGQVVGYSSVGDGESRAFFWDEENGLVELPTLGGNSLARAINNEGQIVGYSYDESGNFYPVMWKVSIRQAS